MRTTLWLAAAFNAFASLMLAFPGTIGSFTGLPAEGPLIYRWLMVLFVALFGAAYAWMAMQPTLCRPLLTMAVVGKTGVFVVSIVCWQLGDIPLKALPPAVIDLIFAGAFVRLLRKDGQDRANA
ncbi:MAG: hypothetical protein JNK75_01165 [Betaproteobacteria bacterium]|nr:hypothetical protein [Betaproteobacteria bacterium]